jgi:enoyl-CoA hydratase/carnithine racemase
MHTRNRLTIKKVTPAYWRATLSNPPINLYDPELFTELRVLMDQIEADQELKVIVFDSADPDFFHTLDGFHINVTVVKASRPLSWSAMT